MTVDVSEIRIEKTAASTPMIDVMGGSERWHVPIHEHGFIALLDVMPRLAPEGETADFAVVQAARVSYGAGTKRLREDRGLIRYLLRHRHTTPFEMIEFKFHVRLPIFVARQWIRHRTASVNEYSGRYSEMPDLYYRPEPDNVRRQSTANRQGGEEPVDVATAGEFLDHLAEVEQRHGEYLRLLEKGVAREQARMILPASIYTEWYWKCDLHNILRFLSLRMDAHAQREFRDYAFAMFALIQPIAPVVCEAFLDYHFEGMQLSRLEIEALRRGGALASDNTREQREWEEKRKRLGLE